jgi:hypothetical protein
MRQGKPITSVSDVLLEQAGLTTWDNFLLVPYGQSVSTNFQYLLPQITTMTDNNVNQYQLTIRKQAGTGSDSAKISVELPPGTTLVDATPKPSKIDEKTIFFDQILDTDKIITVTYE